MVRLLAPLLLIALPAVGGAVGVAVRSSRVAAPRARVALASEAAVAASPAAVAADALPARDAAGGGGEAPAPAAAKGAKKKGGGGGAPGQPLVIGLSHHTAAVEVRERLAVKEAEWNNASRLLLAACPSVQEAATLSTCNRFELHLVTADRNAAIADVLAFLLERSGLDEASLWDNLFMLSGEDAVWHLLRVSAGLDSLVVGEGQILSQVRARPRRGRGAHCCGAHPLRRRAWLSAPQVKACFVHATAPEGSAGKVLGRLLNVAVAAGKRVRSETSIARGAVSISSAAAELADLRSEEALGKPFSGARSRGGRAEAGARGAPARTRASPPPAHLSPSSLPLSARAEASIAIVGAGTMSRLLLTHLASKGMAKVRLLNRGSQRAQELAAQFPDVEVSCEPMEALADALCSCDAVFTSTGASHCIVTKQQLAALEGQRAGRRLMLVDISVPLNVEHACNALEGVAAYNVDDLKAVVAKNQASRRRSVLEAEALLASELAGFLGWQRTLDFVPVIGKMQANAEAIRAAELAKVSAKLAGLDDKQREAVERCTKSIINKILHSPMSYLRTNRGEQLSTREIIEGLFDL